MRVDSCSSHSEYAHGVTHAWCPLLCVLQDGIKTIHLFLCQNNALASVLKNQHCHFNENINTHQILPSLSYICMCICLDINEFLWVLYICFIGIYLTYIIMGSIKTFASNNVMLFDYIYHQYTSLLFPSTSFLSLLFHQTNLLLF